MRVRSNSVFGVAGLARGIGLAMLSGMPPRAADDLRVVHVDRVDEAVDRLRDLNFQRPGRRAARRAPRTGARALRLVGRAPARAVPVAVEVAGLRTRTPRRRGATMDVTP